MIYSHEVEQMCTGCAGREPWRSSDPGGSEMGTV